VHWFSQVDNDASTGCSQSLRLPDKSFFECFRGSAKTAQRGNLLQNSPTGADLAESPKPQFLPNRLKVESSLRTMLGPSTLTGWRFLM
jgi:hypothetical protein